MFARSHALADPGRPAIVMAGSGEVVTYGAYEAAANQVANLLRGAGVGPGGHVAIFSENHPRMLEAEAGAERIGAHYTLVNSYLSAEEVAYIVADCQAQVLIATAAKADVADAAVALLERPVEQVMIDLDEPRGRWRPWAEAVGSQPATPVEGERLGAAMLYSSGTTGRPKGILRPLPDADPGDAIPAIAFVSALWGFAEGMRYLNPAPLYHSAPQASVASALRLGGLVVVMERFDPLRWCQLVEEHRITHTQMVPTMFSRLLRLPPEERAR